MAYARIIAGRLRQRIDILKPNLVQGTSGGWRVGDTSIFNTVWASIEPLTGRELQSAQQIVSEVTHKITIRFLPGIRAKMAVSFKGPGGELREFQIMDIENPNETSKMLVLLCMERDESARESPSAVPA